MRKTAILIIVFIAYYQVSPAQSWQQVGLGASSVGQLYTDTINDILYGLGGFNTVTPDKIFGVAKYDGTKWDSVGQQVYAFSAMSMHKGELYVSGKLDTTVPSYLSYVNKWNGSIWDTVGESFDNAIMDLVTYRDTLYAVGFFGSQPAAKIAKWTGTEWLGLDSVNKFFLGWVSRAIEYKGELYAGGDYIFDFDNTDRRNIVRWNCSNWDSVGGGIPEGNGGFGNNYTVEAFAIYKDELYVAGQFTQSPTNGNPGNNIAKWDGTKWYDVGGGTNYAIKDLTVYNNELYAVGKFTEAGGVPANNIAKWDGTEWCGLGSIFYNGDILTAEVFNNVLYVGGDFNNIDGTWVYGVAKWTGGNYVDTCGVISGVKEEFEVKNEELKIYPNPTAGKIILTNLSQKPQGSISIYNILGEHVLSSKPFNGQIDLSVCPPGVYFLQLRQGEVMLTGKVMKL